VNFIVITPTAAIGPFTDPVDAADFAATLDAATVVPLTSPPIPFTLLAPATADLLVAA
jgi:hypothetical protein